MNDDQEFARYREPTGVYVYAGRIEPGGQPRDAKIIWQGRMKVVPRINTYLAIEQISEPTGPALDQLHVVRWQCWIATAPYVPGPGDRFESISMPTNDRVLLGVEPA